MPTHRRNARTRLSNLSVVILITAGIGAWTYGSRFTEETGLLAMSADPVADSLIRQHNATASVSVNALAQLTLEEILAAGMACQDEMYSARQTAEARFRRRQLALLSASILWLAGLVMLLFRNEDRTHHPSITEDHMACCEIASL